MTQKTSKDKEVRKNETIKTKLSVGLKRKNAELYRVIRLSDMA